MNHTTSITCGIPFCHRDQREETPFSKKIRITAIAIGMITLIVAALILFKIPEMHQLGTTTGWITLSLGGGAILTALSLKCVKKQQAEPSTQPTVTENPPEVNPPLNYKTIPLLMDSLWDSMGVRINQVTSKSICLRTNQNSLGIIADKPEHIQQIVSVLDGNSGSLYSIFSNKQYETERLKGLAETIQETLPPDAKGALCFVHGESKTYFTYAFGSAKLRVLPPSEYTCVPDYVPVPIENREKQSANSEESKPKSKATHKITLTLVSFEEEIFVSFKEEMSNYFPSQIGNYVENPHSAPLPDNHVIYLNRYDQDINMYVNYV